MWSLLYGFADDERALPQNALVRFPSATELFIHLDAVRRGEMWEIPLESPHTFTPKDLRAITVGYRANEEPVDGPAVEMQVRVQVGQADPLDVLEALVHLVGRRVQPAVPWAQDPPAPADPEPPETWPLPEGQWGHWTIEWGTDGPRDAWAHGGMAWGDGVLPQPEWVDRCLVPLFSTPAPSFHVWFEREVAGRRPARLPQLDPAE